MSGGQGAWATEAPSSGFLSSFAVPLQLVHISVGRFFSQLAPVLVNFYRTVLTGRYRSRSFIPVISGYDSRTHPTST